MMSIKESDFKFLQPHLSALHFTENKNFDQYYNDHPDQGDELLEAHPMMELEINKNENECKAYVVLTLKINVNDKREEVPYQLEISTASIFEWRNNISDKIDILLQLNAPTLLLSYMRPIISLITNTSRFPSYDIPFIDFKKQISDIQETMSD